MRPALAQAIRTARRSCELTQEELGRRLGLKGRAVYRWERGQSLPTKRNVQSLIAAVQMRNAAAAAQLVAALTRVEGGAPSAAPQPAPSMTTQPAPSMLPPAPTVDPQAVLERVVFAMADELDLPPRRTRAAVARLLRRLNEARLPLDLAQRTLDASIAQRGVPSDNDAAPEP